jgi:ketosteroid isomerase-like protein
MAPATPHPNADRIARFYAAFAALDAEGMAALYAPDARFADEVFTLDGRDAIMAMWTMLCQSARANGADAWRLEASDIAADATQGSAQWRAWYRFSATGRDVHNRIRAQFSFGPDGLVVEHRDRFDFWAWSRQALGAPGLLLGWTPFLRARVRTQAAARLDAWRAKGGR